MSAVLTPRMARRRFVLLSATRWLSPGLVIPVLVLLAESRGLGIGAVGALFALHGVVVVALELPTGGLADVIGRRVVLVLASALSVAAAVGFAVASTMSQFALTIVLLGIGRALSSGPLEAWYVDVVHATDPAADLKPGLARGQAAEALALAVGAVIGGFLPLVAGDFGRSDGVLTPLSVPPLVAGAVGAVHLLFVALLVIEPPRVERPPTLRSAMRDVPATVHRGVRLAVRSSVVARVLGASAATGLMIFALEVLTPLRFADLAGAATDATAVYGVVLTLGFIGSAAGAALAPMSARVLHSSSTAAAIWLLLAAAAVGLLAIAGTLAVAAIAFVLVYLLLHGASPLKAELLHQQVTAGERATVVSVQSLVMQGGGVIGSATVPLLAASAGFGAAMGMGGLVLLVGAFLLWRVRAPVLTR